MRYSGFGKWTMSMWMSLYYLVPMVFFALTSAFMLVLQTDGSVANFHGTEAVVFVVLCLIQLACIVVVLVLRSHVLVKTHSSLFDDPRFDELWSKPHKNKVVLIKTVRDQVSSYEPSNGEA